MKADHGYNMDSASVQNLLHLMSEFNATQRRDFLQFTTGSPKLPIGGEYQLLTLKFFDIANRAHYYRVQSLDPNVHGRLQTERRTLCV